VRGKEETLKTMLRFLEIIFFNLGISNPPASAGSCFVYFSDPENRGDVPPKHLRAARRYVHKDYLFTI
jgi:hypothetical protein